MIWYGVFVLCMLVASAFFSSTETAYTSLSRAEAKAAAGVSGRMVRRLLRSPDRLLATILIGNNLANIGAAAAVTLATQRLFGESAVSAASGILTLVVLIFCEVTPKRVAIVNDLRIARLVAWPMFLLGILLYPVVLLVLGVSSLITRFFTRGGKKPPSLNAILHMVIEGESAGVVKGYESRMVKSVFRLDDVPIRAIMTHRMDVVSVGRDTPVEDAVNRILDSGFSRIPVRGPENERIAGVVLAKDIMRELAVGRRDTPVSAIMKDPIYVPETHKANQVFRRFQKERLKIAIVIDEYGGFAGIVTLEDIAEEVFGEIYDETDEIDADAIVRISPRTYRIAAEATVARVADSLDIALPESRLEQTLGAYFVEQLGHLPAEREVVAVSGVRLTAARVDRHRVEEIIMELLEPGEDDFLP